MDTLNLQVVSTPCVTHLWQIGLLTIEHARGVISDEEFKGMATEYIAMICEHNKIVERQAQNAKQARAQKQNPAQAITTEQAQEVQAQPQLEEAQAEPEQVAQAQVEEPVVVYTKEQFQALTTKAIRGLVEQTGGSTKELKQWCADFLRPWGLSLFRQVQDDETMQAVCKKLEAYLCK